ncbi:transposase [Gluconobacter cerinus]|uniref:Transposase IS110-like N-terminal domain-containing protein n=1 Tax=Gluconobacter cerinus TaxID=38307 RepID=A0A1B6VPC3_9PROT|nr:MULTISPECIES: transposase [Gluconobacter]AFW03094.1 Insertion element IS110 43.6 kDa protein [Gluconobacter oxydans H24]MBS0984395.1 transposase [Gluconobacter cerinus]MBS1020343.1 transposase [Gluconobacter cerinus]MBS1032967.1 transposase [Gluconobacter cerinus]MBS1042081.1 transposase [Gluconobacter cerinus]
MTFRTIGIDLAIRGDHLAQIYDDGRPNGRAIRFRHDQPSLAAFVQTAMMGLRADDHIQAIMEPTGMSWFPVAHHLVDAGVTVARVKGKRVKALRRCLSEHALYLAADTARKTDPELAELYWRLMTLKGHHHKQALCAVANRIVNRIFSVLKRGKPYEVRDREGNSLTLCGAKAIILERYTVGENIRAGRRSNRIEKNS